MTDTNQNTIDNDPPLGTLEAVAAAIAEIHAMPLPVHYLKRIDKLTTAVYWQGVTDGLEVAAMGDGPPIL